MSDKLTGKCLCGATRFALESPSSTVSCCHCKMCRRWGGGLPLAGVEAKVILQTSDALRWWQSSAWGERGFCGQCGSSLFWRTKENPEQPWEVSVGALESDDGLRIGGHIFVDDKADFYSFADDARRQTGAQFTAETFSQLAQKFGDGFLADALAKIRKHSGDAFADEVTRLLDSPK